LEKLPISNVDIEAQRIDAESSGEVSFGDFTSLQI
jgi:hypothetical protein